MKNTDSPKQLFGGGNMSIRKIKILGIKNMTLNKLILKSFYTGGLLLLVSSNIVYSVLPGAVVVDQKNYWGHNGRLSGANSKATYIVCDGYIGSPLIPDAKDAIGSFANNCEASPPPGSLPIIDVAENHSPNYAGYPAYTVKPNGADHVYFLCDGFLNSTAWCSHEAHSKAQKLLRAAESRYWEAGAQAMIINDVPVDPKLTSRAQKPIASTKMPQEQGLSYQKRTSNNLTNASSSATEDSEDFIDNFAEGQMPVAEEPNYSNSRPQENLQNASDYNHYLAKEAQQTNPKSPQILVLGEDVKNFLVQTVEQVVERVLNKN
jgi:hypothetical protein